MGKEGKSGKVVTGEKSEKGEKGEKNRWTIVENGEERKKWRRKGEEKEEGETERLNG